MKAITLRALLFGAALAGGCASAPAESEGNWSLDLATQDGALLGVWGSSPEDVWVVGGQQNRSLVLHGDGARWSYYDVNASSLLYTIYGFSARDAYAVGENGLILHFDGADWQRVESGTDAGLYGIWGSSGDDVWIVGGKQGVAGSAVVLRGSGGTFQRVTDIPAELVPNVLYKVHGFASNDVVLVGSDGILRYNGTQWLRDAVPVTGPLFSTWGRGSDDMYAVGGSSVGEIVHYDGSSWSKVSEVRDGAGLSGVFTSADGPTFAVGAYSLVVELGDDGSLSRARVPALSTQPQLHAVWGDDAGTTYTVGGDLADYPQFMSGVILARR